MKPALSLRVGQQVTMTPQLQQAIRLMQLSSVELAQEVREAIETNPMLDYPEETDSDDAEGGESGGEADDYEAREAAEEAWDEDDPPDPDWAQGPSEEVSFASPEIPGELPVDTSWDDIYQAPPMAGTVSPEREREFAHRPHIEVVLLGADSERAIRVTHSIYFETDFSLDGIADRLRLMIDRAAG